MATTRSQRRASGDRWPGLGTANQTSTDQCRPRGGLCPHRLTHLRTKRFWFSSIHGGPQEKDRATRSRREFPPEVKRWESVKSMPVARAVCLCAKHCSWTRWRRIWSPPNGRSESGDDDAPLGRHVESSDNMIHLEFETNVEQIHLTRVDEPNQVELEQYRLGVSFAIQRQRWH